LVRTNYVANRDRQYRPYSEAQGFVRKLGLKNVSEWETYCKSGEKPDDIPSGPRRVYGSEFRGIVATRRSRGRPEALQGALFSYLEAL
jgi:hypothetical protein